MSASESDLIANQTALSEGHSESHEMVTDLIDLSLPFMGSSRNLAELSADLQNLSCISALEAFDETTNSAILVDLLATTPRRSTVVSSFPELVPQPLFKIDSAPIQQNRVYSTTSSVKHTSQLKNAFVGIEDSLEAAANISIAEESAFSMQSPPATARKIVSLETKFANELETPVNSLAKRPMKNWSVMNRIRESRKSSFPGGAGLSPHVQTAADTSSFILSPGADISLILNQNGDFLLASGENSVSPSNFGTISRTAAHEGNLSGIGEEAEEDSERVNISSASPARILPPSLTTSIRPPPGQNFTQDPPQKFLLACSTASYRGYRDSPVRSRVFGLQAEECAAIAEGSERSPPSQTENSSESSPTQIHSEGSLTDMDILLKGWHINEISTVELKSQTAPESMTEKDLFDTLELKMDSPFKLNSSPRKSVTANKSNSKRASLVPSNSFSSGLDRLQNKMHSIRQQEAKNSLSKSISAVSAPATPLKRITPRGSIATAPRQSIRPRTSLLPAPKSTIPSTPARPRPSSAIIPISSVRKEIERSEATKDKLEKLKIERLQRQSISPEKMRTRTSPAVNKARPSVSTAKNFSSNLAFSTASNSSALAAKSARPSLSANSAITNRAVPAITSKPNLAAALARKPTSLMASRSRLAFNPTVPQPSASKKSTTSSATTRPLASSSTSSTARRESSVLPAKFGPKNLAARPSLSAPNLSRGISQSSKTKSAEPISLIRKPSIKTLEERNRSRVLATRPNGA